MRQYVDAQAYFTAYEEARRDLAGVRGSMFWKSQDGIEYLIRTNAAGKQSSLGPKTPETIIIHEKFTARKQLAEQRLKELKDNFYRVKLQNKANRVGRAPQLLVDILNRLYKDGLSEYFTVIGTHAIYAYEAAAGVFIDETSSGALQTVDIDLLWDVRKRLSFITQMEILNSSMLGLIKKVDKTFKIRAEQPHTAVNSQGFEVDILRREPIDDDPHPLRLTALDDDEEFFAVQARRAGVFLDTPRFSTMIVSPNGTMARMNTIQPEVFAQFKRWMAVQPDRSPHKALRDILQAELVEELMEHLPI